MAAEHEDDVAHHQVRAEPLGVGAQAGVHVVGGRPDRADAARVPLQRRDRLQQARELDRRDDGHDRGDEDRRDLAAGEGRRDHPEAGRRGDVEQRADRQHQEAPLDRDAEDDQRQQRQDDEVDHPDRDVGELLADQVLEPSGRRDVEVDHRAELLLAHDADRHQDRRDEEQQQGGDAGDDRVDALERRVVHVPLFDVGRVLVGARGAEPGRGILEQAWRAPPVHTARRCRPGRSWRRPPGPRPRARSPGEGSDRSWAGSRAPARRRPTAGGRAPPRRRGPARSSRSSAASRRTAPGSAGSRATGPGQARRSGCSRRRW